MSQKSDSGLVSSEGLHLVWQERPKCDCLSYWNPGTVFWSLYFLFLWHLIDVFLLISRKICVPRPVIRGIVLVIIRVDCCYFSSISQSCHLQKREKRSTALKTEFFNRLLWTGDLYLYHFFSKNPKKVLVSKVIIIKYLLWYFHFSYIHLFLGGKHKCLHSKAK